MTFDFDSDDTPVTERPRPLDDDSWTTESEQAPVGVGDVWDTDGQTYTGDGTVSGLSTPASPPLAWLLASLGTVVAALLATPVGPAPLGPVLTWVVAGPVSILLLGTFFSRDLRERARALYQSPTWVPWATRAVVVLVLVAVVASSWRFADWVARQ
ncbi:hypothetical protein V3N99_21330 [Dermatophilaceae bacterium Soc4.6]